MREAFNTEARNVSDAELKSMLKHAPILNTREYITPQEFREMVYYDVLGDIDYAESGIPRVKQELLESKKKREGLKWYQPLKKRDLDRGIKLKEAVLKNKNTQFETAKREMEILQQHNLLSKSRIDQVQMYD